MRFEIIDHTGDVGLRYFGNTLEELFRSAVTGTASLIGDPGSDCEKKTAQFIIDFSDNHDLMYQLLDKLIFYFEVEEILLQEILSFQVSENRAIIKLEGCTVTGKFQYKYIMKAPTYHKMEINPQAGYGVQIFDI